MVETTALGAAALAGLEVGFWGRASGTRRLRKTEKAFKPTMGKAERQRLWSGWKDAVSRVLTKR
jgi:glycerol kinase